MLILPPSTVTFIYHGYTFSIIFTKKAAAHIRNRRFVNNVIVRRLIVSPQVVIPTFFIYDEILIFKSVIYFTTTMMPGVRVRAEFTPAIICDFFVKIEVYNLGKGRLINLFHCSGLLFI